MNEFIGCWAIFTDKSNLLSALENAVNMGFQKYTIQSPIDLLWELQRFTKQDRFIPLASLLGALVGTILSILMIITMDSYWVLPLSAKPIISSFTMAPVVFVLTILSSASFTIVAVIIRFLFSTDKAPFPTSDLYKQYNRFTRDRFGLIIACKETEIETLKQIFETNCAEEIHVEK